MVLDPITGIGVVASSLQLGLQAFSILEHLLKYCTELVDARTECEALRNELWHLSSVLFHIEETYADGNVPSALKAELVDIEPLLQRMQSITDKRQVQGYLRLTWPFLKKRTREYFDKINRSRERIDTLLKSDTRRLLGRIDITTRSTEQNTVETKEFNEDAMKEKLLAWLCPDDIQPKKDQSFYRDLRTEGTALWVFEDSRYQQWRENANLLWISGIMGSGKSVLMSSIIDSFRESNRAQRYPVILTWFYCNGRSEGPRKMARYVLGSIYRQILEALERYGKITTSGIIASLRVLRKEEPKYPDSRVCDFFGSHIFGIITQAVTNPLYILIDGIDESPDAVEMIGTLVKLANYPKSVIRVLLTCRPERKIEEALHECLRLETTNETFAPDRKTCLMWNLKFDVKLRDLSPEMKDKIIGDLLSKKAVFSLLGLHLDQIRWCERDCDIPETLDSLPPGLPETYEGVLDRISQSGVRNKTLARQALAWLLYSPVPLQLHHLATVACIQPPKQFTKDQKFKEKHGILRIVPTLIYVHPDTKVVELCHFSVTQYLKSPMMSDGETRNKHHLGPNEGYELLMRACLTYLRSPLFSEPLLSPLPLSERRKELKRKLSDRIVLHFIFDWINYAKKLKEDVICGDVCEFLTDDNLASWSELWELKVLKDYCWWQESEENIEKHEWPQDLLCELGSSSPSRSSMGTGLYYASQLDFPIVVAELLKTIDPNIGGGSFISPLMVALSDKNIRVAKILLSNGADVDVLDQDGNTALHKAVEENNYEIAQLLLEYHSDLRKHNKKGEAAIHLAIKRMNVESISQEFFELLLQEPDVPDQNGKTALHLAISGNITRPISHLLQKGANINAVDRKGRSPLHELAVMESPEALKIFDELRIWGASTDVEDDLGFTAFHWAVRKGNRPLVEHMWGRRIANSIDSDCEVSQIELAAIMCGTFPEDIRFQNILGEAYFAEAKYPEAQEQFKAAIDRDNANVTDQNLLLHRAYCVGCDSRIQGRRWKCLVEACTYFDWCTNCMRVRGSVGGLCSHNKVMSIPGPPGKVRRLCQIFEPVQEEDNNRNIPLRGHTIYASL